MRHKRADPPSEIPIMAPADSKVSGGAGLTVELDIGGVVIVVVVISVVVGSSSMISTMLDTSPYKKKE